MQKKQKEENAVNEAKRKARGEAIAKGKNEARRKKMNKLLEEGQA